MASAVGIATLLRSTMFLLSEGIVLLPQDLLTIHNLSPGKIHRDITLLSPIIEEMLWIGKNNLQKARDLSSTISRDVRPVLMVPGLRSDHVFHILKGKNNSLKDARLYKPQPFSSIILWWRNFCHTF